VGGRPPDDADVARAAQAGDVEAYAELVRRHQRIALRVAYVICGGSGEAEDAVQEACVKAYFALRRFDGRTSFRPWLLRIVANEAKNRRRAAGRRRRYELYIDPASGGAAPSPEAAVIADAEREELAAAVAALPDRLRDVVTCRYLLALSESETATALGIAPGTAKSRASRGLERLRRAGFGEPLAGMASEGGTHA
jgi:RNA polymerase sigma-70 factor (ECF subfamily)